MTANLEKRLRKSLGNEALEKRIADLEARCDLADMEFAYNRSMEFAARIAALEKKPRPKKPKPE